MPAGFQVIGDAGNWQVDENYATLALRAQGVATFGSLNRPYNTGVIATVTVNGEFPVIAVKSSVPLALVAVAVSGSTWTYTYVASNTFNGASFSWYAFDRPVDSGSRVGIQVFDAQGRMTFDSAWRTFNVRGLDKVSAAQGGSHDYGSGNLAFVMTGLGATVALASTNPPNPGQPWNWSGQLVFSGVQTTGSGVAWTGIAVHTASGSTTNPPTFPTQPQGQIVVIDVTNF